MRRTWTDEKIFFSGCAQEKRGKGEGKDPFPASEGLGRKGRRNFFP